MIVKLLYSMCVCQVIKPKEFKLNYQNFDYLQFFIIINNIKRCDKNLNDLKCFFYKLDLIREQKIDDRCAYCLRWKVCKINKRTL
jgi:hypothetical protein